MSNFSYFLARINSIEVPDKDRFNLSRQSSDSTQQLLKCILITELDPITFTPEKELLSYPIIRSKVYVADKRIINKFTENLEFTRNSGARTQHLGNMVESGAPINVSFQSLFERHLAIVGSTGSGKSNTAGRLIEELSYSGQRSIIIDPTGEYSNIVDSFNNAIKLTIGEDAFVPVHLLSKLDLVNIFLPSERAQLPKLMAAINSLKTVKALQNDSTVSNLKEFQQYGFSTGELIRTNKDFEPLKSYQASHNIEDLPFDITQLPKQIQNECYYESAFQRQNAPEPTKFGGLDQTTYANCSTLISRIGQYLSDPNFNQVFRAQEDTHGNIKNVAPLFQYIDAFLKDRHEILYINLSKLPEIGKLKEVIVDIISRRFLDAAMDGCFSAPHRPVVMFIDEAHRYLGKVTTNDFDVFTLDSVANVAKEGRKKGLYLCIITQSPKEIPQVILGQIGSVIAHRLTNDREKQTVLSILPANSSFDDQLPFLTPGTAIFSSNYLITSILIKVFQSKANILSSAPKFLKKYSKFIS